MAGWLSGTLAAQSSDPLSASFQLVHYLSHALKSKKLTKSAVVLFVVLYKPPDDIGIDDA